MKDIFKNKIILFLLLSTALVYGSNVKLEIEKAASPQFIEGNRTIHYTLIIHNTSQSTVYNPIIINDNLEDDLFSDANITITNDGNFTCDVNTGDTDSEITCVGSMGIPLAFIEYDVIAPDEGGQVTNTATVSYNGSVIDTAEVTVTVFPNYIDDLDYKRDICYLPPTSEGTDCKQSGSFFYGSDCNTSIQILRDPDGTTENETLTNVHIFKSYTSSITSTDCYTEDTAVSCGSEKDLATLLNRDSSLYFETAFDEAHDFNLGNMSPDENRTIVDINTIPSGQGANAATSFEYIALIGQYNISGEVETIEEYIYPCGGGYSVPPVITQETTGGINDVNLLNVDLTLADAVPEPAGYYIDYATYNKVGTKIVNQPFILGVTYLDEDGNPATYDGQFGNANDIINAPIILQYKGVGEPDEDYKTLWAGQLPHGEGHILTVESNLNDGANQNAYPVIGEAFKVCQIKIELIDYGSFFRALDGLNCGASSLLSSLCLVPACLNSTEKILEVYPLENYPHVATCVYGDGGGASPCDSNAYYGSCGGKKETISPSKYNNDYGCAQCLADAVSPEAIYNGFSVRPKGFSLKVPEWQNGLNQAGRDYPVDLNATAGTGNPSDISEIDNTTQSPRYDTTLEGYHPPEVLSVIGLEANASLTCPDENNESQTITFGDGYSSSPINYHNVGKAKLVIMDQNWTSHDQNTSKCIIDSNETNPVLDPLNLGRVGCMVKTEKSMIFVPDHFNIDANLTDHNNIDNFTYLHDINLYDSDDNYSMGAELKVTIKAMGADNNVTSNYMETCYAKDTNLTLVLNGTNITYPGSIAPLTHFLYYNPVEDNGSIDSGEGNHTLPAAVANTISIPSLSIDNPETTFPADAPEGNGTTHVEYKLNFNRKIDLVVNPFRIDLADINMTDTDDVEDVILTLTDKNATLYYARSRASKFFYEDITESSVITPILIDVYCELSPTACSDNGIDTVLGAIDEPNWYISMGHTAADGNITLMVGSPLIEGTGSPTVNGATNPNPTNITSWGSGTGIDNTVNVATNGSAVPLTVPIELVRKSDTPTPSIYTNEWLIYNPNDPIPLSPFYKVRFIGEATWTGEGKTGHVIDVNASYKKSNRLDW